MLVSAVKHVPRQCEAGHSLPCECTHPAGCRGRRWPGSGQHPAGRTALQLQRGGMRRGGCGGWEAAGKARCDRHDRPRPTISASPLTLGHRYCCVHAVGGEEVGTCHHAKGQAHGEACGAGGGKRGRRLGRRGGAVHVRRARGPGCAGHHTTASQLAKHGDGQACRLPSALSPHRRCQR